MAEECGATADRRTDRGRPTRRSQSRPRLSESEPETPPSLVRIVERMLAKDPSGRPAAAELVKEFTAASTPAALLTPSQVRRRRRKRRAIYFAIAAAGAVPERACRRARRARLHPGQSHVCGCAAADRLGDRSPFSRGTIRRTFQESDINLQPFKRGGSTGGLLIVRRKGAAPDTLFQDLSGREAFLLMNEFSAGHREEQARDSTTR